MTQKSRQAVFLTLLFLLFWGPASSLLFCRLSGLPAALILRSPFLILEGLELFRLLPFPVKAQTALSFLSPLFLYAGMIYALLKEKEKPLHGDAHFAAESEIEKAGLRGSPDTPGSVILGKKDGRFLTLPGPVFTMLSAPTRTGKGVGIVIPNCLSWRGSLAVLDIKRENFDVTSGFRKEVLGQDVFLFSPFSAPGETHRWNPLEAAEKESSPALRIAAVNAMAESLYENASERERFWSESAKDLFRGLALLVLEKPGVPHTLAEILKEASQGNFRNRISAEIAKEKAHSEACCEALQRVLQNADQTLSSVISTFCVPLLFLQDPHAADATSATSCGLDLAAVRRRPVTVYVAVTPDRLSQARVILNLFFNQLISLNTRELPSQNRELSIPCLLLLDEFPAAGRIPMVASAVSYMAGYGLRLLTVIQNRAQLSAVYGRDTAHTLLANHAAHVIFSPSQVTEDALSVSRMLGNRTVKSVSKTRKGVFSGGGSRGTESDAARALLLPQELVTMPREAEIVALDGVPPVLAEKIRYMTDPFFKKRLLGSVLPQIKESLWQEHSYRLQKEKHLVDEQQSLTAGENRCFALSLPLSSRFLSEDRNRPQEIQVPDRN